MDGKKLDNMGLRVLVLNTSGAKRDGVTSWIAQVFSDMDRRGINRVDTIAWDRDDSVLTQLERARVNVLMVPSRRSRPLHYVFALRRLMRRNHYDIVHINGNSGTTALELSCALGLGVGSRIVHSRNTQGEFPKLDKALRPVMNWIATDRLACGRDAGSWLFGKRAFKIIPNGRRFEQYRYQPQLRESVRNELGLKTNQIAVGHIGNFNHAKNHKFLLDAFGVAVAENPNLRLFLFGDGPLRADVDLQVAELGLGDSVTLVGRTQRVPDYLNALDLAVLPSLYEGFPNVVVEAQINGLPTIVSDSVTDECGITDLVTFLSLSDRGAWVTAMCAGRTRDRTEDSANAQKILRAAGYESRSAAERVRDVYASASTTRVAA